MKFSLLLLTLCCVLSLLGQTQSIELVKAKIEAQNQNTYEKFTLIEEVVVFYKGNLPDSALSYAQKQLELANVLKVDSLVNKSFCNLAKIHFKLGDYANSTKYALTAIELSKKLKDDRRVVLLLCLIGRMHASKGEFAKCYESYAEGEKYAIAAADEKLLINIYTGIGNAYFLEKNMDQAEKYFLKCLKIAENIPDFDPETMATIYTNLGNIQSSASNDLSSIEFYKKSLNIYLRINDLYGASLTMFNIGDTYMFAGEYDSSLVYFNRNLSIGKQLQSTEEIYYAYFGLTNLYTEMKEYKKALEYQVLSASYKDSIQKMKYDNSVIEMQKKYEYEQSQKALKIAELEVLKAKEKEVKDGVIMRSNASKINFLWIGAIALLVISVIVFYLYRMVSNSNKVIQQQNTEIQNYNTSIDNTLKQKEILLKEVHHRVKNNLQIIASLLNLQLNRIENELAKEAVSESRNRVQAIALMHKGLYQDEHYNKVNLENYLNELIGQHKLFSIVRNTEVSFKLNVQPILLNIDNAVPIGLILSELISNSIKHAFSVEAIVPVIEISVAENDNYVTVGFKDNGIGLADDFVISESESLGFEIITALTEQINGEIEIKSRKPLEIELKF